MNDIFEKQMLVNELKGLLEGLVRNVSYAKFNLAYDNVRSLSDEMTKVRRIIDRIDAKIIECVDDENDEDDFT